MHSLAMLASNLQFQAASLAGAAPHVEATVRSSATRSPLGSTILSGRRYSPTVASFSPPRSTSSGNMRIRSCLATASAAGRGWAVRKGAVGWEVGSKLVRLMGCPQGTFGAPWGHRLHFHKPVQFLSSS